MLNSFQPTPSKNSKDSPHQQGLRRTYLKILIVYDTTSAQRNTEVLKAKGFDVNYTYADDVDPANVKNCDYILAGAPTQILRATEPIMKFLDKFAKNKFTGRTAPAFDTQL